MKRWRRWRRWRRCGAVALGLCLAACQRAPTETDLRAVVAQQVQLSFATYQQSLQAAQALDAAIATLIATPSAGTLEAARAAWVAARVPYARTETLRFGHGVVDEMEPRVNAWPIDEGLLDYVAPGYQSAAENPAARANFVSAEVLKFGGIEADLRGVSIGTLRYLNELLGIESNVTRGFHPIEFLLWGQDLSAQGPGARLWTDYAADARCTDGPVAAPPRHCGKRAELLRAASQLLVLDLTDMARNWNPDQGSYGRTLIASDPREGLRRMLFGMAALARDELAGQRIEAGLLSGGQEEEQDCFSDNTPNDHADNAAGIAALYFGLVPQASAVVPEPAPHSLALLMSRTAPRLDRQLRQAFANTAQALAAVQARARAGLPYDQMIRPQNSEGRALLAAAVSALKAEAGLLVQAGEALQLGELNPASRRAELQPREGTLPVEDEARAGGATTVQPRTGDAARSRDALSQPAANLSLEARAQFFIGNSFFTEPWVAAPASTTARDGLGPLYNATACQNCHIKDGRGHPPETPGAAAVSFLVKLGRPPRNAAETALAQRLGAVPDPVYGRQIQDRALPGVAPEARVQLQWLPQEVTLADGSRVGLRAPRFTLADLAYGPLAEGQQLSARIAPPMTGLGLLEAIPDAALLAQADPDDRNHDGISGRVNRVWSPSRQQTVIGRFGWKASRASVREQTVTAAALDMGLSSALEPGDDCTAAQTACRAAPQGDQPDVQGPVLDAITFYARHLAPPAHRWVTPPEVRAGQALFGQLGCSACHTPAFTTGESDSPALAGQHIRPYTDLLLHDLGPGLADGLPEFEASGAEWRTPPLWGIHLAQIINPHAGFLHDGRARTLEEAVLWHGGEALAARDRYAALSRIERENLVWFLKSL